MLYDRRILPCGIVIGELEGSVVVNLYRDQGSRNCVNTIATVHHDFKASKYNHGICLTTMFMQCNDYLRLHSFFFRHG